MKTDYKRTFWYLGAIILAIALYFFLSMALQMVWLSAFTHANVPRLWFYFVIYCALFIAALIGLIVCIKRGNRLAKKVP